ncbi:hypothetical protein QUF70_16300 [Desulfobacterales bacterium HSG17]|nr:hypothetical protein [Desulfobacterales bacterium HSG17]
MGKKFSLKLLFLDNPVQAEFSRLLIKSQKLFPSKFRSYLSRMQLVRNCADYSDANVRKKEALHQLIKANEIVPIIINELKYDKF